MHCTLKARREVFAPPWQLLTLVPVATLASVWPLMQLSHARRQIRECRLLPSVSNRSPQQPDLSPGANRPLVARGARHLNVISLCKDSHLRPSRPSGSDGDRRATIVCHPDPADSKYHRSRKPRAMSYLGAQSLPQRRCPGKPAPCTLLLLRRCSPTHCITFGRLWCTTRLRDHLCETLGLSY